MSMIDDLLAGSFGAPGQPVDLTKQAVQSAGGAYGVPGPVAAVVPVAAAPANSGQDVGDVANVRPGEGQRPAGFMARYGRMLIIGSIVAIAGAVVWRFVLRPRKG